MKKFLVLFFSLAVSACGVSVNDPLPLGEWVAPADSLGFEHLVQIGESVICGPSSKCEQITAWADGALVTDEGAYSWRVASGDLTICQEPCGAEWSSLTQSKGPAKWRSR